MQKAATGLQNSNGLQRPVLIHCIITRPAFLFASSPRSLLASVCLSGLGLVALITTLRDEHPAHAWAGVGSASSWCNRHGAVQSRPDPNIEPNVYIWASPSTVGLRPPCISSASIRSCLWSRGSILQGETSRISATMLLQRLAVALAAGLAVGASARVVEVSKKRDVPVSHVLHERQLDHWSHSWEKRAKVPSSALLPMRIGLKQSNIERGRGMLAEM